MSSKIYLRVPPCDPALVEEAGRHAVADLHESMEIIAGRLALFGPQIRPLTPGLRIAGQALTVSVFPGDGLLGHKAAQMAKPGQVLVMTNGGMGPQTMFAELIALAARSSGAVGVVAESCVRDSGALSEMRFPVWSSGVYAGHTNKSGPGMINVPVVCGGVLVNPGDVIVADDDGVICIPPKLLAGVLEKAKARAAREVKIRAAIAEGKVLFDILKLQDEMDKAGVDVIDAAWSDAT